MQIDKEQVLQLLRDKGMHEQANQAQQIQSLNQRR